MQWDTPSRIVALGFTFRDHLAVVAEDGQVRVYELLVPSPRRSTYVGETDRVSATPSTHYRALTLGADAAEVAVAQALVLEDAVWAMLRTGTAVRLAWPGIEDDPPDVWGDGGEPSAPASWPPVAEPAQYLAWAPDVQGGSSVWISTEAQLYHLAEQMDPVALDDAPLSAVSVSPSGTLVAVLTEAQQLIVARADGSRRLRTWDVGASAARAEAQRAPRTPRLLDEAGWPASGSGPGGLADTGVYALTWCGDDTVAMAMDGRVLLLGPVDEPLELGVRGRPYLAGDEHGLRIVHDGAHEYVAKVVDASAQALRPGSTHASALLLDAARLARESQPAAYEAITAIQSSLDEACRTCVEAATHEWDSAVQQQLLQAARLGHTLMAAPDVSRWLRVARLLRVYNAVRHPRIGMPALYDESELLLLLYRLAARGHTKLAMDVAAHMGVRPDAVLKRWARAKIARSTQSAHNESDDADLAASIVAKFERAGTLNYAEMAHVAWLAGRPRVAAELLEREVRAVDQVPLLLAMQEHDTALTKAAESGDTDLVYHVLFTLQRTLARGAFFQAVQKGLQPSRKDAPDAGIGVRPSARATYETLAARLLEQWARAYDRQLLHDYYFQDDRHEDSALLSVADAFRRAPAEREPLLREAYQHWTDDRRRGAQAKWTDDEIQLHRFQTTLEDELSSMGVTPASPVVGASLYDTILLCWTHHLPKRADKLKYDFRVPDARYAALRMRYYVQTRDWNALSRWALARRPPVHLELVASALLDAGEVEQACVYVARGAADKSSKPAILCVHCTDTALSSSGAPYHPCAKHCREQYRSGKALRPGWAAGGALLRPTRRPPLRLGAAALGVRRGQKVRHVKLAPLDQVECAKQVVVDLVADHRVILVRLVVLHKAPYVRGGRQQAAVDARANKVQVVVEAAACVHIEVQGVEIRMDARQDAGHTLGAVEQLGERVLARLALAQGHHGGVHRRGVARARLRLGVPPEMEFLRVHSIATLRALHVLVHERQRHVKVDRERQNHTRKQNNKHGKRSVLKVRHLDLHRTELDTPPNVPAQGWWLEPHRLPVGRLQVFKVVDGRLVVEIQHLGKDDKRIANKEVSNVLRQKRIDTFVQQSLFYRLVDFHRQVIVRARAGALTRIEKIHVHRIVPALADAARRKQGIVRWLARLQRRLAALGRCAVVHGRTNDVPARIHIRQVAAEDGARGCGGQQQRRKRYQLIIQLAGL